jgi:hypothetical protein
MLADEWSVSLFLGDLIVRLVEFPQQFSESVRQTLVGSVFVTQPGPYAGAHNVQIETIFQLISSRLHMRPTRSRFVQFLTFTMIFY